MKVTGHSQVITKSNQTPQILAALKRAGNSYVTVGVHNNAGQYGRGGANAPTPAKVALWLEYGTSKMRRRPFLYPSIARNKAVIAKLAAQALANVAYLHTTVAQGLAAIGAPVAQFIRNTILSNVGTALSGTWDPASGYLGWRREHYPESGQRTLVASGLLLRSVNFRLFLDGKAAEEQAKASPEHDDQAGPKKGPQAGRDEHGRFIRRSEAEKSAARAAARENAKAFKNKQRDQRTQSADTVAKAFSRQKRAYTRAEKPGPKH